MRTERDSMGTVQIPDEALWGAQTQRAVENFPISGIRFSRDFIATLARVKLVCARANVELGILDGQIGKTIEGVCQEIIEGSHTDQFPVDIFQTGSGTSTNMNINEVIANRAIQMLGGQLGSKTPVHPNDHVNVSQSSNDVIPTAIHIAVVLALRNDLIPALAKLQSALEEKAEAWHQIIKTGRTHLQDAVPVRLGDVFGGYARQIEQSINRAEHAIQALRELPLGGTAAGTGLNAPGGFAEKAIGHLNRMLESDFIEAVDHLEANAVRDGLVEASGCLKTIAVSLTKVAEDIRWLGSGPRSGLGELKIPPLQPGSSIMPGKVNPVMSEALIMVAAQVIGFDTAITLGGLGSRFELNTMMPLMAGNMMNGIEWLARAVSLFSDRCIDGLEVDEDRCRGSVESNLALATSLVPHIGYDKAAELAMEAYRTSRSIRQVIEEAQILKHEQIDGILNPETMADPR